MHRRFVDSALVQALRCHALYDEEDQRCQEGDPCAELRTKSFVRAKANMKTDRDP